ncbi:hypothetical protein E5673_06050 [Sphingomonas sp. PAMC26645]|nr:hypothetical protein E5673_06050 [Sphingomonas sp. PAMC26645]
MVKSLSSPSPLRGEGRGEGQFQAEAHVAAPHPSPLPEGEREQFVTPSRAASWRSSQAGRRTPSRTRRRPPRPACRSRH